MTSAPAGPHHVVIVGAGFGGLEAVFGLAGAPVQITLVDRRNHGRGRSAVEIEQVVLEVDGDLMFALHTADAVERRLGHLGDHCRPVQFGGIEFPRCGPQHSE